MVYEDFKQLTAYSRYDGFYLAIVWSASFACLLGTAFLPVLAQFSLLLTLSTPFFVAYRLRVFREEGRRGVISYRRSLLYCLRVFSMRHSFSAFCSGFICILLTTADCS